MQTLAAQPSIRKVSEQPIPGFGYGNKKIEGCIEVMEEHIAGVHGEMVSVEGDLQHLGPLEMKVDSMLEKPSLLHKRMEEDNGLWKRSYVLVVGARGGSIWVE